MAGFVLHRVHCIHSRVQDGKLALLVHISSPGLRGKAVHTSGLPDTSFSLLLLPQSIPEVWSPSQIGPLLSHALHPIGWKQFHNYRGIHLPNKCSDFEESWWGTPGTPGLFKVIYEHHFKNAFSKVEVQLTRWSHQQKISNFYRNILVSLLLFLQHCKTPVMEQDTIVPEIQNKKMVYESEMPYI